VNRVKQEMSEFYELMKTKPVADGYPTGVIVLYTVVLYTLLYLLYGIEAAP
jgi:hypothetical protein